MTPIRRTRRPSYRDFLLLWSGQLFSGLGSGMTAFALGVYVFRTTNSVTGFSLIVLSMFLPSIALKPAGGVLADRFNRRGLMIGGDLGAAISTVALLLLLTGDPPVLWTIYLLVGTASAFSALRDPAYKASITDFVSTGRFSRAAGLAQFAASAQYLLAPALAGVLMSIGGARTVLLIDAITFCVAISTTVFVMRLVSNSEAEPTRSTGTDADGPTQNRWFGNDMIEGWRTVVGDLYVRRIVVGISFVTLFAGVLQTILHPMLLLTTGAQTVGMIQSLAATGMIVSSVFLGVVTITRRHETVLVLGLIVVGISMSLVGLATTLPAIGISLFLFFVALPFVNTSADVLIRSRIPNERQGRAWGIIGLLSQAGYIVAYLSAGFLADNVFEPLVVSGGILGTVMVRIVGNQPGRGMGLMLGVSGVLLAGLITPVFALSMRQGRSSVLPGAHTIQGESI